MKTIWVMGMPRSGTHWLCWLLGDVLNSPVKGPDEKPKYWVLDGLDRPGSYLVRHTHKPQRGITFLIVRDPRDVMVSQMKYWGHSFQKLWPSIKEWGEYYSGQKAAAIVRYEDLQEDCASTLKGALDDAGLEYDGARLEGACWRQRFDAKRSCWESRGRSIPANFFWRGQVGQWQKELTPEQVGRIEELHRETMEKFGYE